MSESERPRDPWTDAGKRLARQSLFVAVTIDQILDIEDEAAAFAASPDVVLRLLRIEEAARVVVSEPWKARAGKPTRGDLIARLREALEDSNVDK